ncbi:MAG: bifunctional glutamate N-acetyltransferase/amino-acid acetyltransferase ArgJ [Candidatus Thermoplasmatota archaeon]|uniref:Arginine biosynthesis bifunctional protein ArgJ n=1 Tax=Candidatus Sysuiplasma superficiale TaxID=2823368 RepID=A0A8J8CDG0_9ARCH|nr:bifunctional glutamate N-acetyltransferase/amino-acid acetyltransferase ArgJ [Candidatus Sysuiplasma superficiale]MCL4346591.1 bifunctional glutamate N-acetyltransferase/amino-acid acetyltransferase ArgJ [Candidatus Thermoplasmatota archaeon]
MKIIQGGVTAPSGFLAGAGRGGIRKSGRDVAIVISRRLCNAAAVFTSNSLKAAPVVVTSRKLADAKGRINGVVVNSGNANALTGNEGVRNAERMCIYAAGKLGLQPERIVVCSTGIIGRKMPMKKVYRGIESASSSMSSSLAAGTAAAEAILTTDSHRKEIAVEQILEDGRRIRIGGMTKGSGMIAPCLKGLHATTLTFITTDAPVTRRYLQSCLERLADSTFNMISVDGDQSTNDTILLLSNGSCGGPPISKDRRFEEALEFVMAQLAKLVVMDGEGATHLIEVEVTGAADVEDARKAAKSVISSNLLKCAVFGGDPNVGRIASALGNSGVQIDFSKLDVWLGSSRRCKIISKGLVSGNLRKASELMREKVVRITVSLGDGEARAIGMGCDLSYDYVRVNSAYST